MKPTQFCLLLLIVVIFLACQNQNKPTIQKTSIESSPSATPVKFQERKFTYLERELDYLKVIWQGEYDNVEQLDFDKKLEKTSVEEGGHRRVHNFTEWIKNSNFGDYVLYIEEYQNDSLADISRQCIYQLEPDEVANGIRIKVFHFKNPKPVLALNNDLQFLKKLNPNSASLEKGCDILLQREGMAFKGRTMEKTCIPFPNKPDQFIDYQIRISEEEFWFQEKIYDGKTKQLLADEFQISPYQLEKSRCFVCMIDFPRTEGGRPVETKHYIKIHDQGGKFEFDYKDGRHMVLGMRNTWSFGMHRETFVIFIQEGSQKGKTLIYSWGAPGADRIGFNPGWIRVQCDLDTPRNVKLQQELRPDS